MVIHYVLRLRSLLYQLPLKMYSLIIFFFNHFLCFYEKETSEWKIPRSDAFCKYQSSRGDILIIPKYVLSLSMEITLFLSASSMWTVWPASIFIIPPVIQELESTTSADKNNLQVNLGWSSIIIE